MHISSEEKQAQLDKILNGRTLHGSESLRAFLRFVVDRTIENQEGQIKEYIIATEVFGRSSDFDSRIDSVVRVQAGRLRAKLQEYYTTEGKDDLIILDLPKGQYSPVFSYTRKTDQQKVETIPVVLDAPLVSAGTATAGAGTALASAQNSQTSQSAQVASIVKVVDTTAGDAATMSSDLYLLDISKSDSQRSGKQRIWQLAAIGFMILTIAGAGLAIFYRAKMIEKSQPGAKVMLGGAEAIEEREIEPLWGDMLRSPEPVLVVFSNTLFSGTAEEGMKLLKSLDAPGSSLGSPIIPQSEIEESREPVIEHYTGIGEVMGAYFLGDFLAKMRHPSRVKRSLLLTWEDLKTENIVVLGSPAENLFLRDLPQKQDFIFKPNLPNPDDNGKRAYGVVNTRQQPGEQQYYFAKQGGPSRSQISEDYAVVGLLEGLNAKNRLLILAGITTLGTQAAAEYVIKPDYIRDLIRHLNIAPPGEPPKLPSNYQVLVKVKVNGGVPVQVSYVTHHVLNR